MTTLARMRDRLETESWPRLNCMLMVALATGAAFLSSVLMLVGGVASMAIRYGVAALIGYATFVLLIRGWVTWKRRQFDGGSAADHLIDAMDLPLPRPSGRTIDPAFGGGGSGGGGATASFGAPVHTAPASSSAPSGSGISLDLDADDLIWILIALVALAGGIAAIGYVVYVAPTLLAEAVVDAAIAGGVYRGLRRHQSQHWTGHVVRRTAIPAAIVILSATVAGYALQRAAPEARSIGGVWAHLSR